MTMQQRFQQLLRELFQFDSSDLDFGIYRIMNHKRHVIDRWITEDLPRAIEEELRKGALAEQVEAHQALQEARQKVLETLGEEALDAEGNLVETYHNTKVGRDYLELQQKARAVRSREALEAAIYNHLYTFFSRYWQDGDFISKRRYSKKDRYAIPYNGEEVYLYWANHDQYYIKTGEYFTDYTYQAPNGVTVHFKLQQADVEQNNVKGEKRFFLPVLQGVAWDETARTLTIPFQFRPLTAQETTAYGQKNQQEAIIAQALAEIPKRVKDPDALAALTVERRRDAEGNPIAFLEHHLRRYTARNTRDFFIHKDLRSFLSRELDFYLKNEVLNLDELEAAGEDLAEGWFQLMRLIKRIGNHIIDFLAQIEDFQKMLWEKKKFVTETFYCITVGNIPKDFYPEIAENEAQWQEWRELFRVHELPKDLLSGDPETVEGRVAFLKAHPSLVLDTRHFSQDFTDRLLASFENLDEMTDGLLVHSENWQALNLLLAKYRERVKCIYIDPPFNTSATKIVYKNDYEHSSWLCLMENRVRISKYLLSLDGVLITAIDDYEAARLQLLLDDVMGLTNRLGNVVVVHNPGGRHDDKHVATAHEYAFLYGLSSSHAVTNLLPLNEKVTASFRLSDDKGPYRVREFRRSGSNSTREARPKMYYPILYRSSDNTLRLIEDEEYQRLYDKNRGSFDDEYIGVLQEKYEKLGFQFLLPIDLTGVKRIWRWSPKTFLERIKDVFAVATEDRVELKVKDRLENKEGLKPKSVWFQQQYTAALGTNLLKDILGVAGLFSYPKALATVIDAIRVGASRQGFVVDYFAGSGTTGHAVINLNREDGGRRKFILVEVGEYFDTVLLPRIKKVTFSPEWKDGKPKRSATPEEFERGPRVVKVVRLESYEDALNNITFDEETGQQALKMFSEEYLLRYMLRWETRKSETLLNVEKLQAPFSYKLHIHRDGEIREQAVDLPETFNYLMGLDVKTRRVCYDGERRYLVYRGTTREGRTVAVIWRETGGWTKEAYERDRQFVEEHGLAQGADEVYVNGDSFIPGAQSLDGLFKARMFAGVEG
ncbi:MAG: site-specific DNA-methyltransferase [Clostridiales bacterium]|nr:site-specific DNA-methyltransferase [Clostridiales bacterium]MBT9260121.1 site-specific DNA-methyltransferase [Clostridiales bacterium]